MNIFQHYLDMPRIYHKKLINLSTYLTIFGVVLNEFVQNCSIIRCIVKYPTIPNNIISLILLDNISLYQTIFSNN